MHENRADVERSVWRARPASLAGTALRAIGEWLGTGDAEVLLIDYHQSHLVPFAGGAGGTPIPVDSHPAGQAFASGRSVPDQDHLFLPLSVYGERLGVLTVRLPAEPEVSQDDLEEVADTLARALRIADTATDIYREVRRRKRLTVAAEMQWELLPGRTEYVFTDVSEVFLARARTKLEAFPFVRYGLLDIGRDPAGQGQTRG